MLLGTHYMFCEMWSVLNILWNSIRVWSFNTDRNWIFDKMPVHTNVSLYSKTSSLLFRLQLQVELQSTFPWPATIGRCCQDIIVLTMTELRSSRSSIGSSRFWAALSHCIYGHSCCCQRLGGMSFGQCRRWAVGTSWGALQYRNRVSCCRTS